MEPKLEKKDSKSKIGRKYKIIIGIPWGGCGVEGNNKWLEDSESEIQPCTVIKICFYGKLSVWDLAPVWF